MNISHMHFKAPLLPRVPCPSVLSLSSHEIRTTAHVHPTPTQLEGRGVRIELVATALDRRWFLRFTPDGLFR